MKKNVFILLAIIIAAVGLIVYFARNRNPINPQESASPSVSTSPSISPSPSGTSKPSPTKTPDTSSGDHGGGQDLVASPVPWDQLTYDASCELKGEIKYVSLSPRIYDNQDALFVYKGIDHPGRNIYWTVTPNDGILVGPNIFSTLKLPDGQSLLGISLPQNPKYKKYEITASIEYGRLVDGNVKVYTKQCVGKTSVILP